MLQITNFECKATSAFPLESDGSWTTDKANGQFFLVGVSALSILLSFNTVSLVAGRASSPHETHATYPKGFVAKQVAIE